MINIEVEGEKLHWVEVRDQMERILWSQDIKEDEVSIQLNLSARKFRPGMYSVLAYNENGLIYNEQIFITD